MFPSKNSQLSSAAFDGKLDKVESLLSDPQVNVNWQDSLGFSVLHSACQNGHLAVVDSFLNHPKLDPNLAESSGLTPFSTACYRGHHTVVSRLLADPRVDPQQPQSNNTTPLWYAAQNGHLSVIEALLASDRTIDTKTRSSWNSTTAAQHARVVANLPKWENIPGDDSLRRKKNNPIIADLIDAYEKDPGACRQCIRGSFIARLFALVVFLCDGFLRLPEDHHSLKSGRFFSTCSRLPLDLQMLVCHRVFGSAKEVVLSGDSELAFGWWVSGPLIQPAC